MSVYLRDIDPAWYKRDALPAILNASTAAGRTTLVVGKTAAVVGSNDFLTTAVTNIDLGAAASWDSVATDYTVAATRSGKDFYLYATTGGLKLSANGTVPTGYTAENSRKIGGFHCLCLSVGTISGHSLTGFLTGDILPASIWDLNFRPVRSPEGMVYASAADIWVDIYLQSGTGASTRSAYGATITDTREYWNHGDDFAAVGKRMLFDFEFSQIAAGSNEQTDIAGSSDPVTAGGHTDTSSRRMISHIGCEDCAGALYHWIDGGHVYRNDDASYAGGWSWKATANGKGQQYTQGGAGAVGLLAGGYWYGGSFCGSRCRYASYARASAVSYVGSRGCARRQA